MWLVGLSVTVDIVGGGGERVDQGSSGGKLCMGKSVLTCYEGFVSQLR